MEVPKEELKIFSPILLQEYIRLLTAAAWLDAKDAGADFNGAKFNVSEDTYQKIIQAPLQTTLIGLKLDFENGILTAVPDDFFKKQYENKIMAEVARTFRNNYLNRYKSFILPAA